MIYGRQSLVQDCILGPGVIIWRGSKLVRLEEEYRKTVVFIGSADPAKRDEIYPWGTAFLVGYVKPRISYLVTAAHVIADGPDDPFDIRLNKKGGGAENLHIDCARWFMHPTNDTVDVAVHPIELPDWADYALIHSSPNLSEKRRFERKNIGVGNRTYTVGLFWLLQGDRRNQPFVYSGHIGLVPEDQQIPVDGWGDNRGKRILTESYLVESQSLTGASGSPVFVRRTLGPFSFEGSEKLKGYVEGSVWLLGLVSDIFTAKAGRDYDDRINGVVPRGVSVVVPSQKILEVLNHPELQAERDRLLEIEEKAKMPMKASLQSNTVDDNPNHKEDFNRLLGAAVQMPKQDG